MSAETEIYSSKSFPLSLLFCYSLILLPSILIITTTHNCTTTDAISIGTVQHHFIYRLKWAPWWTTKKPPTQPGVGGSSEQLASSIAPNPADDPGGSNKIICSNQRSQSLTTDTTGSAVIPLKTSPQQQQQQCTLKPETFRRVCYFRMDPRTKIKLQQVDGNLCTHVILAFARINIRGELVVAEQSDYDYLNEVEQFKVKYPQVKVMISVFHELEFNAFPRLASVDVNQSPSAHELRQKFAKSAMEFLSKYNLDGVDLDWEFPNFPASILGSREHERLGFTKILTQLRSAIVENFYARQTAQLNRQQTNLINSSRNKPSSVSNHRHNNNHHHHSSRSNGTSTIIQQQEPSVEAYLLTVAIAGQEAVLKASYELKQIVNLCDWLNVMSYDYYLFKPYAPFTGPNSPLHPIVDPFVPILSKLSLSWTANKLSSEESLPRDKIVMGIPTYARAYRLLFKNNIPTPFTLALGAKGGSQIDDYYNYSEILRIKSRPDTLVEWDQRGYVPYLLTDDGYTWVSYEDKRSVRAKVKFIMQQNLGGFMTWNLNSDDWSGLAGQQDSETGQSNENSIILYNSDNNSDDGKFPLHNAMLEETRDFFASLAETTKTPKQQQHHDSFIIRH